MKKDHVCYEYYLESCETDFVIIIMVGLGFILSTYGKDHTLFVGNLLFYIGLIKFVQIFMKINKYKKKKKGKGKKGWCK